MQTKSMHLHWQCLLWWYVNDERMHYIPVLNGNELTESRHMLILEGLKSSLRFSIQICFRFPKMNNTNLVENYSEIHNILLDVGRDGSLENNWKCIVYNRYQAKIHINRNLHHSFYMQSLAAMKPTSSTFRPGSEIASENYFARNMK